jgi:Beta-propeller repeat/Abnormal spindle-like microcephaly-assoc'd, ASPM-SPD-2-Hydin
VERISSFGLYLAVIEQVVHDQSIESVPSTIWTYLHTRFTAWFGYKCHASASNQGISRSQVRDPKRIDCPDHKRKLLMKSSATPLRALGRPGAVTAFCIVCVTCVFTVALKSQDRRPDGIAALPRNVSSQGRANGPSGTKVAGYLGALPLAFEPNQGQTDAEVKYVARGARYNVFFTPSETVLVLGASSHTNPAENQTANPVDILRMRLAGANASADLVAVDQLQGKSNYLIGPRENWHTSIPNFRRILQRQVYPGIDISYHGTEGQLEEDFVVSPGADPRAIRLAFNGAKTIRTNSSRELMVTLKGEAVTLRKPVAYQETKGSKRLVSVNYVVLNNSRVGFRLGDYDQRQPLVIDPILSYSTYLGGSNIDGANAIAVAPDKTAFITGGTYSVDFPTTHQLQPNHGGPDDFFRDAFVVKLSADGSTILYSTYIGGKFEDVGNGIAVDAGGDAYVTGTTDSSDFPVPVTIPSFNPECGGDGKCGASWNPGGLLVRNGFVIKLNPEGTAPLYSGFIGFYENVIGQSIAVDENNIAYVTGQVGPYIVPTVNILPPRECPPPFPITGPLTTTPIPFCLPLPQPPLEIPGPTAAQQIFGGGATDAYLWKISATGNTILYATYLGGTNEDVGLGVAVDTNANAYLTGLTYSSDFPVTAGAFQGTNSGAGDAFFAKVNTVSGALLYSSFLGGSGLDQGNGIAVDKNGNAYITGTTASTVNTLGFAPPAGAFQPNCALDSSGVCEGDAFVAKLNPSLSGPSSLIYFTYLGGSLADGAQAIAVDPSGNAYVTGSTVSTDFPVAGAVFQPKFGGGNADAFVTKLDPAGATLTYSGYLGGTNTDIGYGIAVDTDANAYIAGQTCSLDFPLANPVQAAPGGNCDAFVSKVSILNGIQVNPAGLVFSAQSLGTTSQSQVITVTNGDNPVALSSIQVDPASPNPADFAVTTTCAASLLPGGQCTITISFTPQGPGLRKASIPITATGAGLTQSVVVPLNGQASTLTLSASSLSFGQQQVGLTPANPLSITATNNGTSPVTFTSITASGDFSETDDCAKVPLQPSTNCVISITFAPSTAGSSVGALTLTDNAPGSPQIVLLTGTGVGQQSDFKIDAAPSSAIVPAGNSATIAVTVTSFSGFSQPVTLSCAPGLPVDVSCSFSPSVLTPVGSGPSTSTLTISTGLRTQIPLRIPGNSPPAPGLRGIPMSWLLFGIAMAALISMASLKGYRAKTALGASVVLAILLAACSGGGSTSGVPAGTPAGNSQVTITGVSGSLSRTATVSLQVK